jgi:hypothetical protein
VNLDDQNTHELRQSELQQLELSAFDIHDDARGLPLMKAVEEGRFTYRNSFGEVQWGGAR